MSQKQGLQSNLTQHFSATQIELMKLVTIPSSEIEQYIENVLAENPILEKITNSDTVDDNDGQNKDPFNIQNPPEKKTDFEYLRDDEGEIVYDREDDFFPELATHKEIVFMEENNIHQYLEEQLSELNLEGDDYQIARQIIFNLEDDGYLKIQTQTILDDLAFKENIFVEEEDVERILTKVQTLEPAGIAARSIKESLILQLQRGIENGKDYALSLKIITDYFDEFSKKNFPYIQQNLHVENDQILHCIQQISHLNPHPLEGVLSKQKIRQPIIPDFNVIEEEGQLKLSLHHYNDIKITIQKEFQLQLKSLQEQANKKKKEAAHFLKQKIESANWFIQLLEIRKNTLLETMKAIIAFQYDFFISGDEQKIKPMILENIQTKNNLDNSTISRVVNSKYVQTDYGVYPLKFFFNKKVTTNSGEEVTLKKLQSDLKEIIENEDKHNPYTDDDLVLLLQKKGYQVKRRSVTNYRQELNIPKKQHRKLI